ncbi:hypothetical protein CU098_009520 [Rhizopus stolonifer]|uniref:CUE domain-containing protein n=1 Tax=Rhizopus stolonifer TaxID=4846 RepID=A0A367KXK6_RHIST|nr:hypothetical protein CU098_009520 [Rhizopus stolonifer]
MLDSNGYTKPSLVFEHKKMDSYKESDTVQDLFQEIEDLIDNKKTSADDEYSFERPILIESDSDELEEIIEPALSMHTLSTCHKCNRPIASGDSLQTNDLRQQQLQLSDDLLNRLSSLNTPLCLSEDPRTTEEEEEEEYEQDSYDTEVTSSPSTMDIPIPQQPVSILKKTNSSRNMYDTYDYEDDYEDYMPPVEARYPKRGHRNYQPREDYFEYAEPIQQRSSQIRKTYYPSEYEARSKRRVSDMNDEDYYYSRRNSYYAFKPKKPTLEEWEMTLDDLCDLFPRLDRFFIDEFLVSAQGNFDIAKDRIMNMLMEIR